MVYAVSTIYIMPSFREGLSKSMMEAMCYGLPVVASRIRGNTDLLGMEEGGILCNPKVTEDFTKAIEKLYTDKQLLKNYSERNKQFVKNFDIKIVLKQLEEIYREM